MRGDGADGPEILENFLSFREPALGQESFYHLAISTNVKVGKVLEPFAVWDLRIGVEPGG